MPQHRYSEVCFGISGPISNLGMSSVIAKTNDFLVEASDISVVFDVKNPCLFKLLAVVELNAIFFETWIKK
ncbi:hypothetical protein TNIN_24431 [Trichonephila inaurata madagascariensis]|uniref:Uncharacterized protein n=1 Tax=Trichonephila inaurata madagascariensis TaxID=2747483 RepID=A0A8X7CL05_9ARAC|nr:hypothetical protein TNIN_24431 [Trichonephila inaurata madagascariensis]